MPMDYAELLRKQNELHEEITTALTNLGNSDPTSLPPAVAKAVAGVGDDAGYGVTQKRFMDSEDIEAVREILKTKSTRELHAAFAKQASRSDSGIPLNYWLASGGRATQERFMDDRHGIGSQLEPNIAKAIDTTSASALIRQDLEPILYELFVRTFPLFDRLDRQPANGLVHAYDQMTSYGDADWIGELDTVTDDRGTYVRQITNVGILATRRGVSLKSQFAVLQGGAGFNPERLELQAGLRAMSSRYQKTILHGNWTDNTGTLNNELGPYDDDSFDGLRKVLDTASAVNVDPATNPTTAGSMRRAVDAAVLPITEAGGMPTAIFGAPQEQITSDEQLDDKTRVIVTSGDQDITVGVRATRFQTHNGILPFFGVPGAAVSSYITDDTGGVFNGGETVRDIYILDESALSIPYLGSPGPTVLEIPIGVTGQLTHLFIIFFMGGLAIKAPTWQNKIRVKVA
jgi:hypothetical protein